jgi:two-component system nitrogen regulation response regulator NtrX
VLTGVADVFARPPPARRLSNAIERETRYDHGPLRTQVTTALSGDGLYSQSPSMREVTALMGRAATMRAGVTIRGEDGTGRQVVARAIHIAQGDSGTFVSVDCGAHEGDDLETELFGRSARAKSANGSGDAALERISHEGRLHEAIGGTLYLKNVAEASTRVQVRLARLLRDREAVVSETGGTIGFDIRPMAGVDPGIDTAVSEGRVRDELFRRLSVLRIDMPPLRSRREDIPALANYFLRDICRARRTPPKTLSRPALSLIAALPWRGNAVELRTMLEAIVTAPNGAKGISLEDVLGQVTLDGGSVQFSGKGGTLKQARARFERDYIAHVLEQHRGKISEAAKSLGIQRTNLYRKLRALRLDH